MTQGTGDASKGELLAQGEALLARAKTLLGVLKSQARRAFVLELTGTPKAGKSTSVATLQTFFREAGFQVHLLKERAADCPLPMKGHFFFNAWTSATMLAEVLETHETSVDLLILDRGFFDALVWLELQERREQVTPQEKRVFADFILLERWRKLVDTTVIMRASPDRALEREHKDQLVRRPPGSMMNPRALAEFNEALDQVTAEYAGRFDLTVIDTTDAQGVVPTNIKLLQDLLPRIEQWADPSIAVVPRAAVVEVFGDQPFIHGDDAEAALARLGGHVTILKRSSAEADPNFVQFIAAGIHTHGGDIVVLERDSDSKKSAAYGRFTLWVGRHVEISDCAEQDVLTNGRSGLIERIKQDLHLASDLQPELLGLAWDPHQQESQHLGIMFRVPIANPYVAKHLANKQFKKMARTQRVRSVFMTQEKILSDVARQELDLEPWSKHIINNILLTTPDASP